MTAASSKSEYDLIIIGAGPGGYTAALAAARSGMSVLCVDRMSRPGGVCLNMGCIPSKALLDSSHHYDFARKGLADHGITAGEIQLDLAAMMARKDAVVEKLTGQLAGLMDRHKIVRVRGSARLAGGGNVAVRPISEDRQDAGGEEILFSAPRILLAAGGAPAALPFLPFDGGRVISSAEALELSEVPGRLGIAGAGYIGLEMASVWSRLGAEVTVMEPRDRICPAMDAGVARRLERILRQQGIGIRTNVRLIAGETGADGVRLTVEKKGTTETLEYDRLLVAAGRRPETGDLGLADAGVAVMESTGCLQVNSRFETTAPGIFAIGDLIPGPALAHKASAEAAACVAMMNGEYGEVNYDAIPCVVYTHPEAASLGKTEDHLREAGIPYRSGNFPFAGNGRAACAGETDGFVKLLIHERTDRLLGAHIIGAGASELIAECVLALESGASAEDLARTVHAHPTLSEAVWDAARSL